MAKKQTTNNKKRIEELVRKYRITEREAYMAILISWGVPEGDAYGAVMNCPPEYREKLWVRYKGDTTHIGTLSLIKELSGEKNSQVRQRQHDLRSKDGMLDALEEQLGATDDAKQKTDILMKIADLQRMKQEENIEKERQVHYYLPLRCEVCPFKNEKGS